MGRGFDNYAQWDAKMKVAQKRFSVAPKVAARKIAAHFRRALKDSVPPGASHVAWDGHWATGGLKGGILATEPKTSGKTVKVQVGVLSKDKRIQKKAYAHEFGAVIRPKRAKVLMFFTKEGRKQFATVAYVQSRGWFRRGWSVAKRNVGTVIDALSRRLYR